MKFHGLFKIEMTEEGTEVSVVKIWNEKPDMDQLCGQFFRQIRDAEDDESMFGTLKLHSKSLDIIERIHIGNRETLLEKDYKLTEFEVEDLG